MIGTKHGAHDVDLVAVAVGERRAKGTIDQATGQDGLFASTRFTTEERAGDLARGVHALFDVDGKWEEVGVFTGRLGPGCGHEDHGVANTCGYGTTSERGEFADLEGGVFAFTTRKRSGDGVGFSHCVYFLGIRTHDCQFPVANLERRSRSLRLTPTAASFGCFAGRSCYWDSSGLPSRSR